jgi:putative methionine-R-sulfoxide reductase with GAF domain
LQALSRSLARPLETREALRCMHRALARVLDTTICLFGVFDTAAQRVEVVWQVHAGEELPGGSFPLGNGFTSQVIRTGQPRLIRDWSECGPRIQVQYATDRPGPPQSSITVPVLFDERVRGVLSVQSYQPDAFDADDLAFLEAVADLVAVAIFAPLREPGTPDAAPAPGDSVLASMPVGVLVLDQERRLVHMNRAARRLLCVDDETNVIFGYPVDQPQDGRWPLGTRLLTDRLGPLLETLGSDHSPTGEVHQEVHVEVSSGRQLACSASPLLASETASGCLLLVRPLPSARAA